MLPLLLPLLLPLATCDHFSEELLLSPLEAGPLLAQAKFTTRHPGDLRESAGWAHYTLLARYILDMRSYSKQPT